MTAKTTTRSCIDLSHSALKIKSHMGQQVRWETNDQTAMQGCD